MTSKRQPKTITPALARAEAESLRERGDGLLAECYEARAEHLEGRADGAEGAE